jgi:hypothetical protein
MARTCRAGVVPLDDDLGRLLDRLRPDATHDYCDMRR